MKQNTYNVPTQTWNQFGEQGQEYFNRLYESCKGKKSELLKDTPQNLQEGQNRESFNRVADQIILGVCIEATRQHTQQLQTQRE
jgi:hypothetical protein